MQLSGIGVGDGEGEGLGEMDGEGDGLGKGVAVGISVRIALTTMVELGVVLTVTLYSKYPIFVNSIRWRPIPTLFIVRGVKPLRMPSK